MKIAQLRKEISVPPHIKALIDSILTSTQPIHETLQGFAWIYDKASLRQSVGDGMN